MGEGGVTRNIRPRGVEWYIKMLAHSAHFILSQKKKINQSSEDKLTYAIFFLYFWFYNDISIFNYHGLILLDYYNYKC